MLIFTHENPLIVANVKNILENDQIELLVKNEFISACAGEVPCFDAWPQLWLINRKDEAKARRIINALLKSNQGDDWFCQYCKERNAPAFEVCWNCQRISK